MKLFTRIVLALTLTNMVLLPVAQAQGMSHDEAIARIRSLQNDPAAAERAFDRMTRQGAEFLDVNNRPATARTIAASGSATFTVMGRVDSRGNRFALKVSHEVSPDSLRTTYVLMNQATNPDLDESLALDRSTITQRASDAPEATVVALQRMERRFASAITRATAARGSSTGKVISSIMNSIMPSAFAQTEPDPGTLDGAAQIVRGYVGWALIGSVVFTGLSFAMIPLGMRVARRQTAASGYQAVGLMLGGFVFGVIGIITTLYVGVIYIGTIIADETIDENTGR